MAFTGVAGPQSPHPLREDEPVSDSDSDSDELPDDWALTRGLVPTGGGIVRAALKDPEIAPELRRWLGQENGVGVELAAMVVSALRACRNDPIGHLIIHGMILPPDPLPDLSVIVSHATHVELSHTNLREVPRSLLRLPGLTHLSLRDNPITQLPEALCDLVKLSHLDLNNTGLAALPQGIGRSGLVHLFVSGCSLSALPPSMGEMKRLQELWIDGNAGLEESPGALAPLVTLPADCEIYLNREQPFSPQDVLSLPAHELFAGDPESDAEDPAEVPPLDAGVATWLQAAAGPSSGGGARPDLWAGFAEEANAPQFASWMHRMHATVGGSSVEVASGMGALLRRMLEQPEFRAKCFSLAEEAISDCKDSVAMGFNHMQAALLTSRAAAKELSPGQLLEASLQVFNRNALHEFAFAHAARVGIRKEVLEVALALETRLRGRLALPESVPGMLHKEFADSQGQVSDQVVSDALAHVQARQREPGADGLKAFLAGQGQGEAEFKAWVEYLQHLHPRDFDALNTEVSRKQSARAQALGGTLEADEQAGAESKALYEQKLADLVWQLTQPLLPPAGAPQEGAGSTGIPADQVADFQEEATAARARQRLQRGDERQRDDLPRSPR